MNDEEAIVAAMQQMSSRVKQLSNVKPEAKTYGGEHPDMLPVRCIQSKNDTFCLTSTGTWCYWHGDTLVQCNVVISV